MCKLCPEMLFGMDVSVEPLIYSNLDTVSARECDLFFFDEIILYYWISFVISD